MKKIIRIVAIVLGVLLLLLFTAPFLFQGRIQSAVQQAINESVDAEVYFGKVDLSFFRSFPNASVRVQDYGVVGQDIFAEDTLIQGKSILLDLNVWSVVFGDEMVLKKVLLERPKVHVIILEDGTANYDIAKSDPTATQPTDSTEIVEEPSSESGGFQLSLESYRFEDADIRYLDESYPMEAIVKGLDHEGSGNFSEVIYDLQTLTQAEDVWVKYDGVVYLDHGDLDGTINIKVDASDDYVFTLADNSLRVNQMTLTMDGEVAMPGDDIVMDLRYAAPATDFRGLFSIIPGVYQADFKDIQTEGNLQFDGTVKGTYNETAIPGFTLNLKVDDGQVQYPDLPSKIDNINLDMAVSSPDNDLDAMDINIPTFHADLGQHPLDGRVKIHRLDRMEIDGALKGKLNLADVTTFYPIEGTELKGLFAIDAQAKGIYDTLAGTFPKVDAKMSLDDGFVKNADYPTTISDLHFHANLQDADEQLTSARFDMADFHFLLDEEPIDGSLNVVNLENPAYQLAAKGRLDLAKLMQLYPIEGTDISGIVQINDFQTSGTYQDIEAENYMNLPTSGDIEISKLRYVDAEMPGPITVDQGKAIFNADRLDIQQATGKLSRSDYAVSGFVTNYLAYALMDDQPLAGQMQLTSQLIDLNEWMVESNSSSTEPTVEPAPDEAPTEGEGEELSVFPVPPNLDLAFNTNIRQVRYDNLNLTEVNGEVDVKDQEVDMQNLAFQLFGGSVVMKGLYETSNIRKPTYLFDLVVQKLNIGEMLTLIPWVGEFIPGLKAVEGTCNTEVALTGYLNKHMHPVLEDLDGAGLFEVIQGQLANTPLLKTIGEKIKLPGLVPLDISDIRGSFKMENGEISIAPIVLKVEQIILTLSGKQALSGVMDYNLEIDAPNGELTQSAVSSLSNLIGIGLKTSDRIKVNLAIGGTVTQPKVKGGTGGSVDQVIDAAKDAVGSDVGFKPGNLIPPGIGGGMKPRNLAPDSTQNLVDDAKEGVVDTLNQVKDQVLESAQEKAGEVVEDAIGAEATKKLEDLKSKLPFGKKKKQKE